MALGPSEQSKLDSKAYNAGFQDALGNKERRSNSYKGIEKAAYNSGFIHGQLNRVTTTRIHLRGKND